MSGSKSPNHLKKGKDRTKSSLSKSPVHTALLIQKEIIIIDIMMICCIKCVCGTVALQHGLSLFLPPQFLNKDNSLFFTEGIFLVIKELQ